MSNSDDMAVGSVIVVVFFLLFVVVRCCFFARDSMTKRDLIFPKNRNFHAAMLPEKKNGPHPKKCPHYCD